MAAKLYFNAFIPAFSNLGVPFGNSQLFFYYTETTTPAPIYADAGLTTPLANPVNADIVGKYPDIYLDDSIVYRVVQKDAIGGSIGDDVDPYIPGTGIYSPETNAIVLAPGSDISVAVASLATTGGVIYLSAGTYTSPYQNQATDPSPTAMNTPNITIIGAGRPRYNSDYSALVGGSIIKGSFFFGADNITFKDLGFDSGSAFCIANYGGAPQEGLVAFDTEQLGTPAVASWRNCSIENVVILCHKTGKTGDTSNVHALLLENYIGWSINNVVTVKGGAGIVIKSSRGRLNNVYCRGHFKYSVLNKSEGYSPASFNTYSNMVFENLQPNPNILTPTDFDTSGFVIQASSADATAIVATDIIANGVINSVFVQGLSSFKCTDIAISGVTAQNIYDAVILTSNTTWRIKFSNIIGNAANRGVVFGASSTWCSVAASHMQGINGYSYENSGVESYLISCVSDSPTASHIRTLAGSLYTLGGFKTSGTGSLYTNGGGAVVGLYAPSQGYEDKSSATLVYTDSSGNFSVGNPTPAAKTDLVTGTNNTGVVVGPTSGAMTTNDYVGLSFRIRNSASGAVSSGLGEGVALRAFQPGVGINEGQLDILTRQDSTTLSRVFRFGKYSGVHNSYTVAALPSAASAGVGAEVYASNARNTGEGAGLGTGSVVVSNGSIWRIPGVATAVTA